MIPRGHFCSIRPVSSASRSLPLCSRRPVVAGTLGGVLRAGATVDGDNQFYTGAAIPLVTSGASCAFAGQDVGTGKAISVSGLALGNNAAGNYTLSDASGATADVTAKAITATGITGVNRVR